MSDRHSSKLLLLFYYYLFHCLIDRAAAIAAGAELLAMVVSEVVVRWVHWVLPQYNTHQCAMI